MNRLPILTAILFLSAISYSASQDISKRQSIAIVSIETKGLLLDNLSMGNLVRIELEKLNKLQYPSHKKYRSIFNGEVGMVFTTGGSACSVGLDWL